MQSKTFEEFWQMFLQVHFHAGNPERWTRRESKAQWCAEHLYVTKGDHLADLGCGDGLMDIWLSRLGFRVTAVDRSTKGMAHARSEDDTKVVNFLACDLQDLNFTNESLSGIVILETLGLMRTRHDVELLKKCYNWLKPGSKLVTDAPFKPSLKNDWSKELPEGRVDAFTSFDEASKIHRLKFEYHPKSGEPFDLQDHSAASRGTEPGITRYIYTQPELTEMLEDAGFAVHGVPHYNGDGYFGLVGTKRI